MNPLRLSTLGHTWIIDLDGTVLKHNGYLHGEDVLLPKAKAFLEKIPAQDKIIFLTSRKNEVKEQTEAFLKECGVRFDLVINDAPYGERILINDDKVSGLNCAYAISGQRDNVDFPDIVIDETL